MHMHLQHTIVIALLGILAGCASQSPRLEAAEALATGDAYLFGRFKVTGTKGTLGLSDFNMGFAIECKDGNHYKMLFSSTDPVYAIRVKPAECSITEVLSLSTGGYVALNKPAPDKLRAPRKLEAGRAYYLGDFEGSATYSESRVSNGIEQRSYWNLHTWRNDFIRTHKELIGAFPKLGSVPAEQFIKP